MTQARAPGASFDSHLAQVNLNGARLGYLLSAILMPAGFALDLAMAPDRVGEFFAIRCVASVAALALLVVSHRPWAISHPVLLGAGPPLVCASSIQAMILRLDGVVSPYYAGLNLCILAVGVLYTWRWRHALAVSGVIVMLWLVPAIPSALDGSLPIRPFFNNLYFLTLTTVISVASTVIRFRSAEREFTARDQLEQTSEELAATLEQLREVDRLKSEFFANISHELRTPLTLILSPVEDLLATERPEREHSALSIVRRNAQRLLRLIDDLLDLARLEAGGLRLRVAELDLADLARRVVDMSRPTADQRGLSLEVPELESTSDVHGDPHRLEMIVTNLVSNALKFTPEGGKVTVSVVLDEATAILRVTDTGPGIDEDQQKRIFDRFYQVEGSERRRHGGAGIGLALARELARLHGGELRVESTVGQGATFILTLPVGLDHFSEEVLERRRVAQEAHPGRRVSDREFSVPVAGEGGAVVTSRKESPIRLDRGRRARILVVEDEADLRAFIATALGEEFDVIVAADGADALEKAREKRPDLVLTDVMMPNVSGTDLCRAIKADPSMKSTPVVMLTARSGSDSTLEAYSAGADDFVTKPFHTRVLIARIRAQLKLRALGLQLANQARLSTAGTLAAGIAHEVKNPVNAILNAAKLLARGESKKVPRERLLAVLQDGATRVVDIVSSLEEHVRPAEQDGVTTCSVDEGLDSSLRLLAHKFDGITVHKRYRAQRDVVASARQLNQVFLNLLDNAGKAKPKNIWLTTEEIPGSGVAIAVEDDGEGVPPEVAALLFEPFFTTRGVTEGTGLGLFLCRRIVDDAGGTLRYEDREGGGARFVVELPAMEAAA